MFKDRIRPIRVEAFLFRDEAEIENKHTDIIPGTTREIELKVGTKMQALFLG